MPQLFMDGGLNNPCRNVYFEVGIQMHIYNNNNNNNNNNIFIIRTHMQTQINIESINIK